MRTLKGQRGVSYLGLLIILAMFAAIGLFGLKVFPLYTDYAAVSKALEDIQGLPGLGKKGKKGIIKRVQSQLDVDDVKTFKATDKDKGLKVAKSKTNKTWVVTADYEARANYVKNIFIVIHFQKTVEVPR